MVIGRIAIVVCLSAASFAAGQEADLRAMEKSFKSAVAAAESSVACVFVSRRDMDAEKPDEVPDFFGSGVVIDHRLVLTCYHVVRDAKSIVVRLNGINGGESRRSRASIYAADNRSDLAVLILDDQKIETPPIKLGQGEELVKGSFIVGLSHPPTAGFRDGSPSATWGIVSNLRRRAGPVAESERGRSIHNYGTLMQTDARMSVSGSGGAIVDLDGKLVAMTTSTAALVGGENSGCFAMPFDAGMRRVIDVLRKGEEVEYGFLGVQTHQRGFHRGSDIALRGVSANSPAERAGLQAGDEILQVNGQSIREQDDIFLQISMGLAGRETTITFRRRGDLKLRTAKVTLVKLNNQDFGIARNRPASVYGLLVDYASIAAIGFDQPMLDGVVVREVEKGSRAEYAKLGEYTGAITEVNGTVIHNPTEFYREAEKATRANQPVRLHLADNPPRTVVLP